MNDFLTLTNNLLTEKFGCGTVTSRVVVHREDICVIYATDTMLEATVVWDTSNALAPLHTHVSSVQSNKALTLSSIDGRLWHISSDSAFYARSSGRYLTVVTSDGDEIVCAMTFAELDGLISNTFVRIHRSYAVNPKFIAEMKSASVILKNRISLPLSRTCADGARLAFMRERYKI